jgi:hypothetical protein
VLKAVGSIQFLCEPLKVIGIFFRHSQ